MGEGDGPPGHQEPERHHRLGIIVYSVGMEPTLSWSPLLQADHIHGCVIITVGGTRVAWKRCKQPFPALSTAVAELIGVIEAVVVGDSISCMVDEVTGGIAKFLKCDNTAAVSIASSATGAWRTRHLKVRAAQRWKIPVWHVGVQVSAGTGPHRRCRHQDIPKGEDD